MGHRAWVQAVCGELRALGEDSAANALGWCGREVLVKRCDGCGESAASILVHAWCDSRVCPHCQRQTARERVELLTAAALRVPAFTAARLDGQLAKVRAELDQAEAMIERHRATHGRAIRRAARLELAGDAAGAAAAVAAAARADGREDRARLRARRLRRGLHDLRGLELDIHPERSRAKAPRATDARHRRLIARRDRAIDEGRFDDALAVERQRAAVERRAMAREDARARAGARWRWRLVTVSPRWRPTDVRELSPARLRQREAEAFARARRIIVDSGYGGGLASWTARCELSDGGHVHVHALVYGPFLRKEWAAKVAGCFVDIREIEVDPKDAALVGVERACRDALRETVKYAVKTPTPLCASWLLGERVEVLHPALAARWVVATRGVHLLRHGGPMRDAVSAESLAREGAEEADQREGSRCPCCLAELGATGWRSGNLLAVLGALRARFPGDSLREAWRKRLRYTRSMPGAETLRG